ncbi:MAG: DUF547 domain-containing protein [Pirellulales bacterium]|nr:DUF547 domain-containing protein [Pirellulales bacterium]
MSQGKQYYGGYFWVAVVSFIVPLAVAAKAFHGLAPTTKPTPKLDVSGVDHAVWDYLLKSYVAAGLVDYRGIGKDYLFREYLRELGAADIDALATEQEKLALCCNAYNAFVINGVISHKITDSVQSFQIDGVGFFDLKEHIFAGKTMSLNELEHKFIRPTFKDPRVHVALVCAARSCPGLRSEAYVGQHLHQQLEDQSDQFANNRKYVRFLADANELKLSPILSWYGDDWNQRYPNGSYLQWIAKFAQDPAVKQALAGAIDGRVKVTFAHYDWALNSQATPGERSDSGGHSGGFGSGTIPEE